MKNLALFNLIFSQLFSLPKLFELPPNHLANFKVNANTKTAILVAGELGS